MMDLRSLLFVGFGGAGLLVALGGCTDDADDNTEPEIVERVLTQQELNARLGEIIDLESGAVASEDIAIDMALLTADTLPGELQTSLPPVFIDPKPDAQLRTTEVCYSVRFFDVLETADGFEYSAAIDFDMGCDVLLQPTEPAENYSGQLVADLVYQATSASQFALTIELDFTNLSAYGVDLNGITTVSLDYLEGLAGTVETEVLQEDVTIATGRTLLFKEGTITRTVTDEQFSMESDYVLTEGADTELVFSSPSPMVYDFTCNGFSEVFNLGMIEYQHTVGTDRATLVYDFSYSAEDLSPGQCDDLFTIAQGGNTYIVDLGGSSGGGALTPRHQDRRSLLARR